ncbi:MAG TPA: CotH kinase family protein, partial [Candidatus Binatia bacterium]|nr:CotH kinase family protein [Candidatus Binatia bacterium]
DWERPGSVELIFPDGRTGFQVDCGVRIQGGWNRRPEESPKHAFRLAFRRKYGSAKLKFRLFERAGTEEFDGLILRAGCNNTWLHWSSQERSRGDYVRDQWMRDSQAAMGHPSARGTFVHFYLNGLYWGLYNLTERPNEHFAADHFGGKPKDYDARNGDHVLSGDDSAWKQMVSLANAGLRSAKSYETMEELLDVTGFIDFMVLNLRRCASRGLFAFLSSAALFCLLPMDDCHHESDPTRKARRVPSRRSFGARRAACRGSVGPRAARWHLWHRLFRVPRPDAVLLLSAYPGT